MTKQSISALTPEAIQDLKRKHGPIQQVAIIDGDDIYSAVIREPDLKELSAANAISKTDEIKGSMVLLEACLIAADAPVYERAVLQMQVVGAIGDRMNKLSRTVKLVTSLHSGEEYIRAGTALIRSNLHINPEGRSLSEWSELYAEALWLEQWRLNNQAEMLAKLFGGKDD